MDFRLNLAKFKPSAGFAQQFKSAGCDGLTHPLVIPKPVLSARNLLTAGSETADSARGKPRLGMTTPWRLHRRNAIRVLDWPGSAVRRRSDRDDRRPWPRRPGVLYSLPGLGPAHPNAFFQPLFPFFPAYWLEDAVLWHAQFSITDIRQQPLHFMLQIRRER